MPFLALGLTPALCDAVKALGFSEPTPIQREAIAPILRGTDVWASAQTGSGKTAAFALPLLQRLIQAIRDAGCRSIYYFCGNPAGKWDLIESVGADALSLEEGKESSCRQRLL